jgi:hypothetical protein
VANSRKHSDFDARYRRCRVINVYGSHDEHYGQGKPGTFGDSSWICIDVVEIDVRMAALIRTLSPEITGIVWEWGSSIGFPGLVFVAGGASAIFGVCVTNWLEG